ncbi:MAG TPA: LysE family transporter [Candidatus Limnocylindrales bacterium]
MDWLIPLIGFSAISSGTPGPNNLLLWASGTTFGFRRTLPHVVGTAVGLGAMALGAAAGIAALVAAVPGLAIAMKVAGSIYLLYLAWQVAGASALERTTIARPMGILQAAAFQLVNPKAWIFALGAITTFRPADLPVVSGSVAAAATMVLVILPTAGTWAAGGAAIARLFAVERTRRVVGLVLAVLLAASVVLVWI